MGTAITKPDWLEDGATTAETVREIRKRGKALANDKFAWEQLKFAWEQTVVAEQAVLWMRAEVVGTLCAVFGKESDGGRMAIAEFAREVGKSPSLISQYKRTYEAFSSEGTRYPQLSMAHHIAAAYTEDPHKWIEKALVENYTVEALRMEINAEKRAALPPDPADRDAKTADELAQAEVAKHVEQVVHLLTDHRLATIFARQLADVAKRTGTIRLLSQALNAPDQIPDVLA